ncbi:MAG: hypothetical protein AB1439_03100 [candidate division FCPU426 bacterium]
MASDNNIYSYVIPYADNYAQIDFRANHKDKITRSTHYALNYSLSTAMYDEYKMKNYLNNILGGSLEEDLSDSLVALFNANVNHFDYNDSVNSKYDYLMLTTQAALRFYIFAFDFTSVDWGLEYSMYNLPNYNFEKEGWTPSLSFLEEVAEYNGFGSYLTIKQALPYTLDLELTGKISFQHCPERPLFASATQNDFSSEYRQDLETTLLVKLTKRVTANSFFSLATCFNELQSNANAQVYDTSLGGVILQEEYYRRSKLNVILDSMICFGPENSFFRIYATYRQLTYSNRKAQDAGGNLLPETRADNEYSALVEFNQRLGYLWKFNCLLKLGYQYTQNLTNDYLYNYKRDAVYLGLTSYLYL